MSSDYHYVYINVDFLMMFEMNNDLQFLSFYFFLYVLININRIFHTQRVTVEIIKDFNDLLWFIPFVLFSYVFNINFD